MERFLKSILTFFTAVAIIVLLVIFDIKEETIQSIFVAVFKGALIITVLIFFKESNDQDKSELIKIEKSFENDKANTIYIYGNIDNVYNKINKLKKSIKNRPIFLFIVIVILSIINELYF